MSAPTVFIVCGCRRVNYSARAVDILREVIRQFMCVKEDLIVITAFTKTPMQR